MGIVHSAMELLEQSENHRNYLQLSPLFGRAREYLREVAIRMTASGEATISEEDARSAFSVVASRMREAGQIMSSPEPATVANALTAHHVLERLDYPAVAFRFEHHVFQEFYAAEWAKSELWELQKQGEEGVRQFTRAYVNEPAWAESLRMVAEEIDAIVSTTPGKIIATRAGKNLVEMALRVDAIFAAELSRLCGASVWGEVGSSLASRLLRWYGVPDIHHQRCALAAMLASGSSEFSAVILPLLTSDDQQVRLRTYRALGDFHLSTLGADWETVVRGWNVGARVDFVYELVSSRHLDVGAAFAHADESLTVREAAILALSMVAPSEDIARFLDAADAETFRKVVPQLPQEMIPISVRPRALTTYEILYRESTDPVTRLRSLLNAAALDQLKGVTQLKAELSNFPSHKIQELADFVIKPALHVIRHDDPEWVSNWVATQIANGAVWPDNWIMFVSGVAKGLKETLLEKIERKWLKNYASLSGIALVLAASADETAAESLFARLCALEHTKAATEHWENELEVAIETQVQDVLRAFPSEIVVRGCSPYFSRAFDVTAFAVMTRLLSTVGRTDISLGTTLNGQLRKGLRAYLKDGIPFALSEDDPSGRLKADLVSLLAQVGEPEDMADLRELIHADIERVRRGQEAIARGEVGPMSRGAATRYSNWNVQAVTQLDPSAADTFLLELLEEPEYERDAAWGLVRLTSIPAPERRRDAKKYELIWQARAGQRPRTACEERRKVYAAAIKTQLNRVRETLASAGQTRHNGRLKELAKALAAIDSSGSAELVLDIMSLPGEWDGWARVDALETLLRNGVVLPTNQTVKIVEPIIEQARVHGLSDNNQLWLLKDALCILPFLDSPHIGIDKLQRVISELNFRNYELREIVTAVGHARCEAGLKFLLELASDSGQAKQLGNAWINAIAALDSPAARQFLLSFVDPDVPGCSCDLDFEQSEAVATHLGDLALRDEMIGQRLLQLCSTRLAPGNRLVLSIAVSRLQTEDAILAALNLLDDGTTPAVPHPTRRQIEAAFVERRPYGTSETTFMLTPRSASAIKTKLADMAVNDAGRKKSAFGLLGEIEEWRLEYGRPDNEPRHPVVDSGGPWPPLSG